MINRSKAASIANETVRLVEQGAYVNAHGASVPLAARVAASIAATELIRPGDWPAVHAAAEQATPLGGAGAPLTEVTDETTLAAARRLTAEGRDVLALNFASAKNAGGGFLGGSQAQEESLARSSALYASLRSQPEYYDRNRAGPAAVYTDHAIYSPRVSVFRDDEGALLDAPYEVSFVTMPAVNVSAMRQHGTVQKHIIERTMRTRINYVLALAAARGHRNVILGAWGCGVFKNDPQLISNLFAEALEIPVGGRFERVTFAVFDPSPERTTFAAFRDRFDARTWPDGQGSRPPLG